MLDNMPDGYEVKPTPGGAYVEVHISEEADDILNYKQAFALAHELTMAATRVRSHHEEMGRDNA